MMYDFHYPLRWGKLNEDTANCNVKYFGNEERGKAFILFLFWLEVVAVARL